MNAQDRKNVASIISKLETLQAQAQELGDQLRELAEAEQDKFDNMPEGLQASERGQALEQAAEYLGEAADCLESSEIGGALDSLGNMELD